MGKLGLSLILTVLFSFYGIVLSNDKSICGPFDDRRPSFNPSVGRVLRPGDKNGCSITLVGKTCAITAGHCNERLEMVEFNVPLSDSEGKIRPSDASDVYLVDKKSIVFQYEGKGNDWSVFRMKKNNYSNAYPGERFGYIQLADEIPDTGDQVFVYSYGSDATDGELERNYIQQVSAGPVLNVEDTFIRYTADTRGGSSGASVIGVANGKIYGIHTHGWCDEEGGWNSATSVIKNHKLNKAIESCLKWEREHL